MVHGEEDPVLTQAHESTMQGIDSHDPEAVRQLTASLWKRDFDLTIDLPLDRLCPSTSRYIYVRWIQDLMDSTNPSYYDGFDSSSSTYHANPDKERRVVGLDIGTGASCIYTLLALRTRPNWFMNATDIDEISISSARKNAEANDVASRCRLLQTKPSDPLIPLDALELEHLDFTICNPPFFASLAEWQASIAGEGKSRPPNWICTGAQAEMVTEGGDLGFVLRMVEESRVLGTKVQWYTSMLGKLASAIELVEELKRMECENWAVCCLGAQHRTRRWAVAWSWGDIRPKVGVARRDMSARYNYMLPFPSEHRIPIQQTSVEPIEDAINGAMRNLELQWKWNEVLHAGVGRADRNVWSRSARRKRKREQEQAQEQPMGKEAELKKEGDDAASVLGFMISITFDEVVVRWMQGQDQVLFESICGMIKQTLQPLIGKQKQEA